jgi:hypothetical protein
MIATPVLLCAIWFTYPSLIFSAYKSQIPGAWYVSQTSVTESDVTRLLGPPIDDYGVKGSAGWFKEYWWGFQKLTIIYNDSITPNRQVLAVHAQTVVVLPIGRPVRFKNFSRTKGPG